MVDRRPELEFAAVVQEDRLAAGAT